MKFHFEVVPLEEVLKGDVQGAKPVVLVVDDDKVVADTMSMILAQAGYATMTAYAPMHALEIIRTSPPALLLSDIAMPEMNGVALAIAVCAMHPECGVLLISGHATSDDLVAARDAGYNFPLLQKPVHPTVMLRYVEQQLMTRRDSKPGPQPYLETAYVSSEVA